MIRNTGYALICVIAVILIIQPACQKPVITHTTDTGVNVSNVVIRDVRVLIAAQNNDMRIRMRTPFSIRRVNGPDVIRQDLCDWTTISTDADGSIHFGQTNLGPGTFDIVPAKSGLIDFARRTKGKWSPTRHYPGFLRLAINTSQKLRIVNFVDIESYVACVLPGEVFPDFHSEAYRAQAIAARTYALYQMCYSAARAYDVTATEASQVYQGVTRSGAANRARDATAFTRGIVATWSAPDGEQIFCTYYSSCCGGRTQKASNSMIDAPDIPPLAGGVACDDASAAPARALRWGPLKISKSKLTSKLVQRNRNLRKLGRIERLEIAERNKWGRLAKIRLVGHYGKSEELTAEAFRLAIGSRDLRSTKFRIESRPESFVFSKGQGFGHGVGLCQWGMQAMAQKNHRAADILKHYYPTMNLTRAY